MGFAHNGAPAPAAPRPRSRSARQTTSRGRRAFRGNPTRISPNDGETGGPKECGSADNSDAAKGLVVDAVVAVVAAVSIYAVALF